MHSLEALDRPNLKYMEKENAPPYGRISTHMPFILVKQWKYFYRTTC